MFIQSKNYQTSSSLQNPLMLVLLLIGEMIASVWVDEEPSQVAGKAWQ